VNRTIRFVYGEAAIKRVGTFAGLDLDELTGRLEALGLGEPGNRLALRFQSEAGSPLTSGRHSFGIAAIMRQADAPPKARIQAITILLDRGWGNAPQPHTEDDPFPLASRECVMTRYRPRQFTLARPLGVAHLAHLTENHPSERRCVR
jgi:hypothetical protein